MRIIRRMRRQKAVYWAPVAADKYGKKSYEEPIEIDCRWEDCQEMYLDVNGNSAMSRARVYVDRKLEALGVLWLPPENVQISEGAALTQLTDETDPFANSGTFEIRKVDELPELRVRAGNPNTILHTVWL